MENHTQNSTEVGRDAGRSPNPIPLAQSRANYSRLTMAMSSCVLNVSKDGDAIRSLGKLV